MVILNFTSYETQAISSILSLALLINVAKWET
jgi:hypothetical protein